MNRSDDPGEERPLTILVAMGANLVLAGAKFLVAATAGSAALFAEGVHSIVDTLNQGLLLVGARQSHKPPDSAHPFGYGKAVYFWTLIYSVLLAGIGGGVSIYEGIAALRDPQPPRALLYSFVVLSVALVAEGTSWVVALRTVDREEPGGSFLQKLARTRDPSRFVVVAEDFAALVGVLIAGTGIGLTHALHSAVPDAVASILIGLLLCTTALILTMRTRDLLVGQAAAPDIVAEVERIAARTTGVHYAGTPLTMQVGPRQIVVAINVRFDPRLSAAAVARCVDFIEEEITERFPEVQRIFVEAQLANRDVEREAPDAQAEDAPALVGP